MQLWNYSIPSNPSASYIYGHHSCYGSIACICLSYQWRLCNLLGFEKCIKSQPKPSHPRYKIISLNYKNDICKWRTWNARCCFYRIMVKVSSAKFGKNNCFLLHAKSIGIKICIFAQGWSLLQTLNPKPHWNTKLIWIRINYEKTSCYLFLKHVRFSIQIWRWMGNNDNTNWRSKAKKLFLPKWWFILSLAI